MMGRVTRSCYPVTRGNRGTVGKREVFLDFPQHDG